MKIKILSAVIVFCILLASITFVIAEPKIEAVNENYVTTNTNETFFVKGFIKRAYQNPLNLNEFIVILSCSDSDIETYYLLILGDIDQVALCFSHVGEYAEMEIKEIEHLDLDYGVVDDGIELLPAPLFGDVDDSGAVDIDDVTYLVNYIFTGGPAPIPFLCKGDANGSGSVDIDDVVYLIGYIFVGGPAPAPDCCL